MNTHFSISGDDGSVQGAPILSREEVEAFLPDYAFGDIAASDKAKVEASLGRYPDLAEELRLIQESFEAVQPELEALDRQQMQRLKNLTIHIQDRLQHEAEKRAHRFRLMKFFVPALAMCVLLAVISVPQAFNTNWSALSGRTEQSESAILTPEDIQRLEELPTDESLVNASGAFANNAGIIANGAEDSSKEAAMAARKMLTRETLNAIAANRSAFQGYFDNSDMLDNISDDDADGIAAAMTEMEQL